MTGTENIIEKENSWLEMRSSIMKKNAVWKQKEKIIIFNFPSARNIQPHLGKQDLNMKSGCL